MKITTKQGVLIFELQIETDSTIIKEDISSSFSPYKISKDIIGQLSNAVIECNRWNDVSDLETAKNFVENLLTDKEIRELIKQLEN